MSAKPSLEKDDCTGELGSSTDRILARVDERFLMVFQLDEKGPEAKAFAPSGLLCCGIEPALSRDNSADVGLFGSDPTNDDDRKGLVEGVGLEVFDGFDAVAPRPGGVAGENLDGTVPARGLRDVGCVVASAGPRKSGKPS